MALGYMAEAQANKTVPSARHKRRMAEGGEARRYNQHIAGMTRKQRSRRERILQEQLYNARVNVMARLMVNWFLADEKGQDDSKPDLNVKIASLLKTFTVNVAEKIREAARTAAEAQILSEQNERIQAEFTPIPVRLEPTPYTQEELDALNAAGEA